jgi:predicted metal-dependent peptidase
VDLAAVNTQLGAARTRLILEHPFIGALVMHLPLVPADARWCATVGTNARALYYNPAYIADLTLAQTQFVLAHEALHCALGHFARRSHRVRLRWDVACDHAVNWLLAEEGLKPPAGTLANPDFRGLAAEEIYPLLPPDTRESSFDCHLYDEQAATPGPSSQGQGVSGRRNESAGAPPESAGLSDTWDDAGNEAQSNPPGDVLPVSAPAGQAELARRWQGRMAAAAQQARRAGRLSSSWLRLVDELIQPQLPWRQLLARYLANAARDDYSFQRPSRREGDALLPRLASGQLDLHVALDTSGSIQNGELAQFAAEVDALKGQIRARVTLHACDEKLDPRGPWVFQPWEAVTLPQSLGGGGGTRFGPVFEWLAERSPGPDLLVYFTDAEGDFPPKAPGYPVLWLVKGGGAVPWGERIQLN